MTAGRMKIILEPMGDQWRARFVDGHGISHHAYGESKAEAVLKVFEMFPHHMPLEVLEEQAKEEP